MNSNNLSVGRDFFGTPTATTVSCWEPIKKIAGSRRSYAQQQVENARLSGAFAIGDKFVYIKRVFYNYPATVVLWSDGTKTVSKCSELDTYSEEAGLTLCILKKLAGATSVRNVLEDWLPGQYYEEDYSNACVDVKDVRAKYKANK